MQYKEINNLLTITDAAKFTELSRPTIYKWLKYNKSSLLRIGKRPFIDKKSLELLKLKFQDCISTAEKIHRIKQNHFIWTENMKQILDGELLGDGNLSHYSKRPFMDAFFQFDNKSKEHCKYIIKSFPKGLFFNPEPIKIIKKNLYRYYGIRSRSDPYLTEQFNRWYPDKKKIIPSDLKLTATVCYHWYIGDGYLRKREKRCPNIHLYTDGFFKNRIEEILIKQLIDLKIYTIYLFKHYKANNPHKGFAIRIGVASTPEFLKFIGEPIIKYYKYKWILH